VSQGFAIGSHVEHADKRCKIQFPRDAWQTRWQYQKKFIPFSTHRASDLLERNESQLINSKPDKTIPRRSRASPRVLPFTKRKSRRSIRSQLPSDAGMCIPSSLTPARPSRASGASVATRRKYTPGILGGMYLACAKLFTSPRNNKVRRRLAGYCAGAARCA